MAKSCGATQPGADRFSYPFNKALEGLTVPRDMFGGDEQKFSSKSHLGSARAKLCQIQGGRRPPAPAACSPRPLMLAKSMMVQ